MIKQFYIYLLFEFQTSSDKEMPLRIAEYAILFIRNLYRKKIIARGEKHPPVLPIVIYNGKGAWTAKLSCSELCEKTCTSIDEYQPEQKYFLLDVMRLVKESLSDESNLSAILFRMEQCKSLEDLIAEIQKAKIRLKGDKYEEFRLLLSEWIRFNVITQYRNNITKDDKITLDLDLEEVDTVLRETLDNIGKKCKNEGLNEGIKEGIKVGVKNVAVEMIKEGFSLDMIAKMTKMPVSEIKSLKV